MKYHMSLSNVNGIFVLVAAMLGYGIITLPCVFARMGWLGGTTFLLIGAIFSFISIYLLFMASSEAMNKIEKQGGMTFYQLFEMMSPILGDFSNILLAIYVFLATVTYHFYIVSFGLSVTAFFAKKMYTPFLIAIPVAALELSLSFLPDMSSLSKVTYLSISACSLVGLLCVRYAFLKPKGIVFDQFIYKGFPTSFGNIVFALSAQTIIPELYSSLNASASTLSISFGGVIIGTSLCLLMGLAGYFTGGSELKLRQNILEYFSIPKSPLKKAISESSFDSKGYSILIAIILFLSLLICSYALLMFSAKKCLFYTFNRHITKFPEQSTRYRIGLMCVSLLWITGTTLVSSLCYPQTLLNLNGIYLGNLISYILPPVAFLSHCGKKNRTLFGAAFTVLLFGIASMSYSTYVLFFK